MSAMRYEPWNLLNRLQGDIDRLFASRPVVRCPQRQPAPASDWMPAVDIREEDTRYVIHADVPGVDPTAIEVSMEDGVLAIKGERRRENGAQRQSVRRTERVSGSFLRRFSLPDSADAEAISATSRHGVLEIVIPKQHRLHPKRIQVEV
jgi:HSP20 family protein